MSSRFFFSFTHLVIASTLVGTLWHSACHAKSKGRPQPKETSTSTMQAPYEAETRLIAIYKMIGAGQAREALPLATELTRDFPTFQLGHLVYGDLLSMQTKPVTKLGELPSHLQKTATAAPLAELREESLQRIKALQERPAMGTAPSQILGLAARNKHVIAIDASKSRLYVLENGSQGLRVILDTYISVGKEGIGKYAQGDLKTPLGVYYLTTPVDPKLLAPLYGGGALPINYPNPLDQRMGKSGNGIWLHGTMPERYSRPVKATDGCVVMANPDLQKLMAIVAVKTTPVIIASKLQWVRPEQNAAERIKFESVIASWREAKNSGQADRLYSFYASDFQAYGKSLDAWWIKNLRDMGQIRQRPVQWKDLTILAWQTGAPDKPTNVMIVTYDEVSSNRAQSATKRQYWIQTGTQWKIFFEGSIAAS